MKRCRYWQQWSPAEVGGWLVKIDLGDFSKVFMQKNIPGKKIVDITDSQLREFGMTESEIEIYVSFLSSLLSNLTSRYTRSESSSLENASNLLHLNLRRRSAVQTP